MAAIPDELNFQKEEFAKQLPWIEPLIRRLNLLSNQVKSALSTLTIGPNVVGQVEVVPFTTSDPIAATFPLYFSVKMAAKPRVVCVGDAKVTDTPEVAFSVAPHVSWQLVDKDGRPAIKINHITGLVVSFKYTFTFLCLP